MNWPSICETKHAHYRYSGSGNADSFYMNFITYAQQELNRQGYRVTLAQSHENPNAELANLQMFEDYRVEGILISVCHTEKNLATYQRIMKKAFLWSF